MYWEDSLFGHNNRPYNKVNKELKRRKVKSIQLEHVTNLVASSDKNIEQIKKEAVINKNFLKLVKKFSPGPLTYVLKKRSGSKISKLANKGLATIAVRIPSEKNTIKL